MNLEQFAQENAHKHVFHHFMSLDSVSNARAGSPLLHPCRFFLIVVKLSVPLVKAMGLLMTMT